MIALLFALMIPFDNAPWLCREVDDSGRVVSVQWVYTPASDGFDRAAVLAAECRDITTGAEQTADRTRHSYVIDGPPGHAFRRVAGIRTPGQEPDVYDWRYYVLTDGA